MQNDTAKRLCKLAAQKIGNPVYISHSVSYHTYSKEHQVIYRVTYFRSQTDCKGINFNTWDEAYRFLKKLSLEGIPNV